MNLVCRVRRDSPPVGAATWMAAVGGRRMNCVRGVGKYVRFASPTNGTGLLVCIRRGSARRFVRRYRNTPLRAGLGLVAPDEITGRPG